MFLTLALAGLAAASPAPLRRDSISALGTSTINSFTPYSYFASAGYCAPAATLAWNCGTNCDNNPGFKPIASGGNGDSVQYWYVGYDPALNEIIVAHQGTNPSKFESLLTDGEFVLEQLNDNSILFPGLPDSIETHDGFKKAQADTAADVLAAVQEGMSQYSTNAVTLVGHSLGAAIALIDSVYLPLHLPASTSFKTYNYGLPRVGNQAFADYVDANVHLTHINNEEDPIPIVPGRFLGFVHPAGEVHIEDSGKWASCPGQDNDSGECIVGDVGNIFDGDLDNHSGPYNGVTMGC
ncbi:lipase [Coniophora puteana RWD-64-598 SS2]|uniref:Lipase n=1 Tax=Coniophora puteana (strain RWD-64-598) TaxID=741705 RepID=A0A5M3N927_CONPW|nr:lipase [Coniophora puteana RWD-64-598 SS2]EIW87351.1 lipase [Coniophora puteana RWD-64-598 SS2]